MSSKFDHLPQDFDQEVIWKGIQKPKRRSIPYAYFWIAVLVIVPGLLFLHPQQSHPASKPEKSNITSQTGNSNEKTMVTSPNADRPSTLIETQQKSSSLLPKTSNSPAKAFTKGKNALDDGGSGENDIVQIVKMEDGKLQSLNQDKIPLQESKGKNEVNDHIEPLPYLLLPLETKHLNRISINKGKVSTRKTKGKQSLAFRTSIGFHHSKFTSSKEEAKWRENLEKPQLDYGLCVRYEYVLQQNFLLSFSLSYQLYKDKITASHVHETSGQDFQIDYKLYNHYQVYAGQVEMGKRFFQKEFFWDANGGIGLKFKQTAEVDYFLSAGELANKEQVQSAYHNPTDVFFTAQAAIGKHLGNRLFVRTGAQINTWIDLTPSQAETNHRILPVNGFVELGLRF